MKPEARLLSHRNIVFSISQDAKFIFKISCSTQKDTTTTKSVIGYMTPYTEELWKSWMKQFTLQTKCQFTIRTGVQGNQNTSRESGVIKFQQSVHSYKSVWTHTCVFEGRQRQAQTFETQRKTVELLDQEGICLRLLKCPMEMKSLKLKYQ